MKKAFILMLAPIASFAVKTQHIWGELPQSISKNVTPINFKLINKSKKHERYQFYYKNIPVYGYQLIKHPNASPKYTGIYLSELDEDIQRFDSLIPASRLLKNIRAKGVKKPSIKKIIYIDNNRAKQAYLLKYYSLVNKTPAYMNEIVDAHSGKQLKIFNGLHTQRLGQGPGGNYVYLKQRSSDFQYGMHETGLPSLGRIDVKIKNGHCFVENKTFLIVNMQNKAFDWDLFPIDTYKQSQYSAFSYPCHRGSHYINSDDNGYAPINNGLSPINDAMYFAQSTLDMYEQFYEADKPFGNDLPIRIYTHVSNLDNAFSMSTEYDKATISVHQQVVIGNGQEFFAPLSQTTIPHELSHNVTSNHSGLIYEGQSGAINEAFSDMADLALRDYLSRQYSWYWDGSDWSIGLEESLSGKALRYMDEPGKDGYSIDTAKDYKEGMDVHFASGVFNRAFYLLAHKPKWNTEKAFQVMFDANRFYWLPNTNFDYAACGVIQASKNKGWDTQGLIDSFKEVGVNCPLKIS